LPRKEEKESEKKRREIAVATFATVFGAMMVNQFKGWPISESAWSNSGLLAFGVALVIYFILSVTKLP